MCVCPLLRPWAPCQPPLLLPLATLSKQSARRRRPHSSVSELFPGQRPTLSLSPPFSLSHQSSSRGCEYRASTRCSSVVCVVLCISSCPPLFLYPIFCSSQTVSSFPAFCFDCRHLSGGGGGGGICVNGVCGQRGAAAMSCCAVGREAAAVAHWTERPR